MKEIAKLIIVLTLICAASGSLMALVYDLTKEPIAKANLAGKVAAIKNVLPECDNNPIEDTATVSVDGKDWEFFIAKNGGAYAGAAFVSTSSEGYGGKIHVMVGVNADGKVEAIEILAPHAETPGLGAKITEPAYRGIFSGLSLTETKWAVTKDGGEIDGITAATISSRAVVNAVKAGVDVYLANKDKITQ
jgi:electron transport complex protein RnfG